MNRESYKIFQKKFDNCLDAIDKWINSVDGKNPEKVINFVKSSFQYLNDKTKKFMYDHITDISDTKLREVNKLNDLMKLINELLEIKKEKELF